MKEQDLGATPKTAQKGSDSFTMEALHYPLAGNNAMARSEQQIEEYLMRCGLIAEPGIVNTDKATAIQKRREENYHNISSLLGRYRSLVRTYEMYKEEFAAEVIEGTSAGGKQSLGEKSLFDRLSEQLEIMSVTEEKQFQFIFAPQIVAGRKIEVALNALHFGLKALKAENEDLYKCVYFTYIKGDKRPTVREVVAELGMCGNSTYYARLNSAKSRLANLIFGYSSNQAELFSILVYLRQQDEDAHFPDYE